MDQHHAKTDSAGPDRDPADKELIDRVREGDLEAFDPLYRRHRGSALRHARYWTRSEAAAEDLSAESFTRVLYAIRNGNGPTEAFRPYLLTAMRNVARDWAEGDRRTLLVADLVDVAPPEPDQDPVIAALERSLAGTAFSSLPERWQTVLWQTEVEQEGPTQLAPQLGIDAAAVAALAYRAREGLKQAYLQAHITEIGSPSCRPFAERLGTHTRGKLRGREAAKVRHHLKHCAECVGLYAMLKYVNANIHVLIGPAVVGAAAAARAGVMLAGAGTGAAGGAAVHTGGAVGRIAAKARHASPRQQAVVAGATAVVAVAAIAFALTGNESAPPVAAPKPSPAPVLASQPVPTTSPQPQQPTPSPAPTSPAAVAPVVQPSSQASTTPPASPSPAQPSPTPTTASPSPGPTPSPSSTARVNCPDYLLDLDVNLLGTEVVVQVGLNLDVRVAGVTVVVPASCETDGPPRPYQLPTDTAGTTSDS